MAIRTMVPILSEIEELMQAVNLPSLQNKPGQINQGGWASSAFGFSICRKAALSWCSGLHGSPRSHDSYLPLADDFEKANNPSLSSFSSLLLDLFSS